MTAADSEQHLGHDLLNPCCAGFCPRVDDHIAWLQYNLLPTQGVDAVILDQRRLFPPRISIYFVHILYLASARRITARRLTRKIACTQIATMSAGQETGPFSRADVHCLYSLKTPALFFDHMNPVSTSRNQ
jgi:hypothetical protein